MELPRFTLILTLALIIILAAVMWFLPSNDDFWAENPSWNGTEDISSIMAASPLESLSQLPPSPQGSTLILIPHLSFSQAELAALDSFVSGGGTLILADDYGYGNQVLELLGLEARFSGHTLLDPLASYKNQWFPRVSRLTSSPLTDGVTALVLNHATCLVDVAQGDVLARSSSFSFLDENGNQGWDEGEAAGPLPVISRHGLAQGQVILIADPSLFINSMETLGDNLTFIQNIGAITTAGLFIDQSHLPPSNLNQAKKLLAGGHDFITTPAGTLGLVIASLLLIPMLIWHQKKAAKLIQKGGDNDHRTEETPNTGQHS